MNEEEFEELFGNTPIENIEKIHQYISENYIPVQIIEDFIKKYQKLSDEFYEKFLETNRTDKDLHDVGLACDSKVDVLKKVLKEGKEFNKAAEEIDKYCKNGGENNDNSNKK